ncbi:MAG: limonene2-epoxide hydrolase [Mycobacterium sp.]|jgi:hypothetical protein|nr:limonene2-epoxide hydrolase [Mycobacterium sp.]
MLMGAKHQLQWVFGLADGPPAQALRDRPKFTSPLYEHSETWTWVSGETTVLPFVSVHHVADGKVTPWKDHSDLAGSDTSWVFDATGLI